MRILRKLIFRRFETVLYRTERLDAPTWTDLAVETVGPRRRLTDAQRTFLRKRVSSLALWRLLYWQRKGRGWLFLVRDGQRYCHYTFVTLASRYRRQLPTMTEERALFIGPCMTEADYRGRGIYPQMLRHAVAELHKQGWGTFYIAAASKNVASLRGMEKTGFTRCETWAGTRVLFDLFITSKKVAE